MPYIKKTKFKGVFRLILNDGESLVDIYNSFSGIYCKKYQVVGWWDATDKYGNGLGEFLGFSSVYYDMDKNEQDFIKALQESKKNGVRVEDSWGVTAKIIDIEIKIFDISSYPPDLEWRD